MKREKVYISAPIAGYDYNERKSFFRNIAARLVVLGYHPVNPMNNGLPKDADVKDHLRADFQLLLGCDRILLCEGWEDSAGCQKEASIALWSGILVLPLKCIE